jgi:NADPH-dependent 2,4-dienoyl-CoA reductase/sulfur reductase-like enzyme
MPSTHELVVAGGGLAAARAVETYRSAGGDGRLALVTDEATLPYHRPPLSKRFLRGETDAPAHVHDEAFYRAHDVDVILEAGVASVDLGRRVVMLTTGEALRYEKLLLATGARPRRLEVPGADRDEIFTLRTVADSAAIRDAARTAARAVVVGGGFIGMEVAASLRQLGLAVTLVHRRRGLFDALRSERLSRGLASLYGEWGVDLLLNDEVARFGGDRRLRFVATKRGVRLAADLAVVGVGVIPATSFLDPSGLALGDGVRVDERFETNAAGVYAVGDVANFHDPLDGRRRRVEHWSNADYQGSEVGRILAGEDGGYDKVASFFTEVFGITIKVFGDTSRFTQLSAKGSLEERDFLAVYRHEGRLVGAVTVGQPEALETRIQDLIGAGASVGGRLRDLVERSAA